MHDAGFCEVEDQASGLRKLLGSAPLKVIALAGAGAGTTTVAVSLAAALATVGADVLLVDENASHGNVADQLGIGIRFELIHALSGERTLQQVVRRGPAALAGLRLLPAARGARELALARRDGCATLVEQLRAIGPAPDFVIVDSAEGSVSRLFHADEAVLCRTVVIGATRDGIKAGYALIKALSRDTGAADFRVVVNRAHSEVEARSIFANLAEVARRHAGVGLEYLSWMPNDPQLRLARSAQRAVGEAFPLSAAAAAARRLAHQVRHGAVPMQGDGNGTAVAAPRRDAHQVIHSGLAGLAGGTRNGHPPVAAAPSH